ncbi:hypothetical protein HU733_02550 [Pseudomonas paralactis]|uniref:hypothetical protein n=1 Tax=Pseudomonas paralactis TaxID=1615673 RepID=UPI0016488B79|nr:hypothetical protein [Pseudomonas paralactis]MBC3254360.1 hypothetical protein [Pseudomonas paralactis]
MLNLKNKVLKAVNSSTTDLRVWITASPVVLAFHAPANPRIKRDRKTTKRGDIKIIEARIRRSLRIAVIAALVIILVVPVSASTFITSSIGKFVMRSMNAIALLAIAAGLLNTYLLNRRLNKSHGL